MSKIYVVKASAGEYSDRVERTVAAYTNEEDAKQHVLKGEEQSRLDLSKDFDHESRSTQ